MGYACPVCGVPQRDGEHLANHLAFTAMLREDAHETWLDEHVSGWGEETPAELAERVTEHAEETEYDEVFEDTTGGNGTHDDAHDHTHGFDSEPGPDRGPASNFEGMAQGVADEAVESVLQEAQDLTEEMYGLGEEDGGEGDSERTEGDTNELEGNDS